MKVLIVAGNWDTNGGRKSGLIEKMYNAMAEYAKDWEIDYFNGGNYSDLEQIIQTAKEYTNIFWFANVPNDLPKVRNIKAVNPIATVIGSKRNNNEYTFVEVLNKSLEQRNNLTIEFSKTEDNPNIKMLLFDPLGAAWYDGYDINELVVKMVNRIKFINTTRRDRTHPFGLEDTIPNEEDFFEYVREVANIFHKTIEHADGVTRFLGNASFRKDNKHVYVSQRDVDKAFISRETFVKTFLSEETNILYYYGDKKPSKDAIVQANFYKEFPNINYIVHSHCYVKDAPFTKTPVPCGALDEIDEVNAVIRTAFNNDFTKNYYAVNLYGHGCLVFGNSLDDMRKTEYATRHLPENLDK